MITFLTTTLLGLIIVGATGSLTASVLIWLLKKITKGTFKLYRLQFNRVLLGYFKENAIAAQARGSSYRQTVLVWRYLHKLILNIFYIIMITLIFTMFLNIITINWRWIIVFIFGFLVVIPAINIVKLTRCQYLLFDQIFDLDEIEKLAKKNEKKISDLTNS